MLYKTFAINVGIVIAATTPIMPRVIRTSASVKAAHQCLKYEPTLSQRAMCVAPACLSEWLVVNNELTLSVKLFSFISSTILISPQGARLSNASIRLKP